MNLEATLSILAGGPGSGCRGSNCGRKARALLKEHDRLKNHRIRRDATTDDPLSMEKMYRMQKAAFKDLADRVKSEFGNNKVIAKVYEFLDNAERLYYRGNLNGATSEQEGALQQIHSRLRDMMKEHGRKTILRP